MHDLLYKTPLLNCFQENYNLPFGHPQTHVSSMCDKLNLMIKNLQLNENTHLRKYVAVA